MEFQSATTIVFSYEDTKKKLQNWINLAPYNLMYTDSNGKTHLIIEDIYNIKKK